MKLHRGCKLLLIFASAAVLAPIDIAVDPRDELEECPGPAGRKNGDVTSTAIEPLGVDGVSRCYPGPRSGGLIQEIEWRCETRYCCEEPCNCSQDVLAQSVPCPGETQIASLICLVQHLHAQPRYYKWKCCEGFAEHPDTHQCLITCEKDNGDCHQLCTPSKDPPHQAECSCFDGHRPHDDDPKRCVDHNECLTQNGGCSDICNNTIGSYECRCKEGRRFVEGSKFKCEDIPPLVIPQPATQESDNSNTTFMIVGIVGGLILLAVLILLLIFLCKKKKRAEEEPYTGTAYDNATYGDLHNQGQGARASVAEYGDTEAIKKKLPIEGAVGVDNPGYDGEKKKAMEAAGYAVTNVYEEIPCSKGIKGKSLDNPSYVTGSNDGHERPLDVCDAKKMSIPGEVEELDVNNLMYQNVENGARPKQTSVVVPPEYSEIPTPGEVEADPRLPTYNMGRLPVRFKDFQDVKYDNMNNKIVDQYVDIKDIDVESKDKQ